MGWTVEQNFGSPNMDDQYANPNKVFVGGLGQGTTTPSLRAFFQQFGGVVDAAVVADKATQRSRGFGFCIFQDAAAAEACLNGRHKIDGVSCEVRRAIPRDDMRDSTPYDSVEQAGKIFVGGLPEETTEETLRSYFEGFGPVKQATLMYDKTVHRPRGFGFVIFENSSDTSKATGDHPTLGRGCSAKKAEPRSNPRRNQRGGGRFEGRHGDRMGMDRGGYGGGMGPGQWWDDRRMPRDYRMGRMGPDMRSRPPYGGAGPAPYGGREGYGGGYNDGYGDYQNEMMYGGGYGGGGYGGGGNGGYHGAGMGYSGYDQQHSMSHPSGAYPGGGGGYGKDSYGGGGGRNRSGGYDGGSAGGAGYGNHMPIGGGNMFGPQRSGGQFGPAGVRTTPY
eukprot:GHVN01087241.1.p1 GENE.GHVN01087241.1~~GHVN01087241.1.p1  ORF type:complete len:390 (+),score=45.69 GHVN01087241.1:40-1209(+)